jgi:integrase
LNSRALTRPLSGIGQVVQRLRAKQFSECEELPDVVLRTMAAKAEKTRESIRYNYFNWKRWVAVQPDGLATYPAAPDGIARYLQDHAPRILETRNGGFAVDTQQLTPRGERPKSLATLARFLAVLATIHREAGHEDPTKHPEVVAVWRVLRRGLRKPQQKARLVLEVLWSAALGQPDSLEGKRDAALLLVAYALMGRRSELVALSDGNLERHADGSITVRFARTKTQTESENHLPPPIAAVLERWLEVRPGRARAVFTRLDRAGGYERLSSGSVIDIMRRALRRAGVDLDLSSIGSHSARIGAAYDLAFAGAADSAIMRDGAWKTPGMVVVYTRGARAREGALAKLLEGRLAGEKV